jgi:hypothetical protein
MILNRIRSPPPGSPFLGGSANGFSIAPVLDGFHSFSGHRETGKSTGLKKNRTFLLSLVVLLGIFFPTLLAFSQDTNELPISAEFIEYIKAAANPTKHGQGKDGRFYPYSTPQGYRIGYRQAVPDKALHMRGWSAEEADAALVQQLQSVKSELRQRLQQNGKNLDLIQPASREILLDYGFTEGVTKLKPEWIQAVTQLEWERILNPDFYVRYDADWPDSVRNKAFFERWEKKGAK